MPIRYLGDEPLKNIIIRREENPLDLANSVLRGLSTAESLKTSIEERKRAEREDALKRVSSLIINANNSGADIHSVIKDYLNTDQGRRDVSNITGFSVKDLKNIFSKDEVSGIAGIGDNVQLKNALGGQSDSKNVLQKNIIDTVISLSAVKTGGDYVPYQSYPDILKTQMMLEPKFVPLERDLLEQYGVKPNRYEKVGEKEYGQIPVQTANIILNLHFKKTLEELEKELASFGSDSKLEDLDKMRMKIISLRVQYLNNPALGVLIQNPIFSELINQNLAKLEGFEVYLNALAVGMPKENAYRLKIAYEEGDINMRQQIRNAILKKVNIERLLNIKKDETTNTTYDKNKTTNSTSGGGIWSGGTR